MASNDPDHRVTRLAIEGSPIVIIIYYYFFFFTSWYIPEISCPVCTCTNNRILHCFTGGEAPNTYYIHMYMYKVPKEIRWRGWTYMYMRLIEATPSPASSHYLVHTKAQVTCLREQKGKSRDRLFFRDALRLCLWKTLWNKNPKLPIIWDWFMH